MHHAAAATCGGCCSTTTTTSISSSVGLHSGVRVTAPPSTSGGAPWRLASAPPLLPPARRSRHLRHPRHQHQHHVAAAAPGDSSSSSGSSQAYRFRHLYDPQRQTGLPQGSWAGWPLREGVQAADVATEDARLDPEATLWQPRPPPGAADLRNPWAQRFRVTPAPAPLPASLPGSSYWQVEALQDYSRAWPSLKWVDGRLQFRKGFLEPFDDPKVVPFFFYRGLEQVAYSWGDRAFQALFAAVYAGVHLALFGWFWRSNPPLALAVGLNWGLGKLSLAKWGILLFLACNDRLWLYFLYLVGKLVDRALARLFPPVREFCWAMFSVWLVFVAVSPAYYYPLPFRPFAPGTLGPNEAIA